ncbi:MAG: hypothetical protein LBR65_02285 [Culturomica sp.]|jgi:hypothetical protein|nr:hypothetical protein [Culturomica sp.]
MKRACYLILFLLFSLFSAERAFAVENAQQQQAEWTEDREDMDRLAAILTANRVADISLQQNNPFGNQQQCRRYPVSTPSFFKEAVRWSSFPVVPEGKNSVCRDYSRYLTQKKEAGYYIYALRKIII